jgi:hypothetical protein
MTMNSVRIFKLPPDVSSATKKGYENPIWRRLRLTERSHDILKYRAVSYIPSNLIRSFIPFCVSVYQLIRTMKTHLTASLLLVGAFLTSAVSSDDSIPLVTHIISGKFSTAPARTRVIKQPTIALSNASSVLHSPYQ